jgi:hypothetical protein
MFDGKWARGWQAIAQSLRLFARHPVFLVPILAAWLVYAPVILWLRYSHFERGLGLPQVLVIVFVAIAILSISVLLACDVLLGLVRQAGEGSLSLGKAVGRTLGRDLLPIIPLALIWAIIWFALIVLECIFSKKHESDDDELTARNAAETLAGYNSFSLSGAFFEALEKGVRMVMFLILPAISWEGLAPIAAIKKGLAILRAHVGDFAVGYAITYAAAGIIFLPPAIIFELGTGRHGNPPLIHFPASVWTGVIIYIALAWSFSLYLEQMSMAQLYLRHLAWDKETQRAKERGAAPPAFKDIAPTGLLAQFPDSLD